MFPWVKQTKNWNKNKGAFCFLPKGFSFSRSSSELNKWYWSPWDPDHYLHSGHFFYFGKVQFIQQERNWVKWKILEALDLYIQTTTNTCNLNLGTEFDCIFLNLLVNIFSFVFSCIFVLYCCIACFSQFPVSFCDKAWSRLKRQKVT